MADYMCYDNCSPRWLDQQGGSPQSTEAAYEFDVTRSEILNRGWVHQEWTLSRRILTFSKLEIFLEG
ncbi:hypothetical protein F4678DRAFT_466328 [Xylaria arbuscula]|nr:hypothetical protein F4678DRAFT_466328 [Xylaria arbuscula]